MEHYLGKYPKLPPISESVDTVQGNDDTHGSESDTDENTSQNNGICSFISSNENASNSNRTPDTPKTKGIKKRFGRIPRGGISPLARFRVVGKMVIKKILPKIREEEHKRGGASNASKEYLNFDKNYYKANLDRQGLTGKEKHILQLEPNERTTEDLNILKGVVSRLKCFEKYTPKVRHELSRVVFYMTLDAGRYIIKQGHDGFSFYFVISGKVEVRINDVDAVTGEKTEFAVAVMGDGSSFGELALMHNCKRTASIVCIANGSQFLRVDRFDFERVLAVSTQAEWTDRLKALKELPCMYDLDEDELNELNTHCRLIEYLPGSIIKGNTDTIDNTFMFIHSGVCEVVRELTIVREIKAFGLEKLHLFEDLTPEEQNMLPGRKLHNRRFGARVLLKPVQQLWSVGLIGAGYRFGLGENLRNTYIIAKSKVEVLQIRRIKFIKQGRWRLIDGWRREIDKSMPTNQMLLKKYKEESYWDRYKQHMVKSVISGRKMVTNTEWDDVPISLRENSVRAGALQKSFYTNYDFSMKRLP